MVAVPAVVTVVGIGTVRKLCTLVTPTGAFVGMRLVQYE